ncbi:MAG: bifunctional phosphopantothenoylcysteine decarboxylase/phosphopantothenate--cysteine ligase CoaBC [Clostridia bacterium]|nr:bifunctional phosphopantothenoylcysteine decarboxylase/phosphopantothenate--cysteine ligase CoaBC [Clostridia bacterium]
MKKKVLVGVTGGIAAYKSAYLVSALVKMGCDVHVLMTDHAKEFVTPLTFETLSKNPVTANMFRRDREWEVEHVSLAKSSEVVVIAPATANFIGKIAHGVCDDMLTTTYLASKAPKILCPAMNTAMYEDAVFQENLAAVKEKGAIVLSPVSGRLACGDVGVGKMVEPDEIAEKVREVLDLNLDFLGKKAIVTAGATVENIDGVRFLSNHSSGKMGIAIAERFADRGADVTLIAGSIKAKIPDNVKDVVYVSSTEDMFRAVTERVKDADFVVMAAAPADYAPCETFENKVKSDELVLKLKKTPDIAKEVGRIKKPETKLAIFSAETENLLENARGKLLKKNADLVVANDVTKEGAGFNTDTNIVTIIEKTGEVTPYEKMPKIAVADVILDRLKTV